MAKRAASETASQSAKVARMALQTGHSAAVAPTAVEEHSALKLMDVFVQCSVIRARELGCVLRLLGQSPSEAQVHDMIESFGEPGAGDNDSIDFAEFLTLMAPEPTPAPELTPCGSGPSSSGGRWL